MQRLALARGLSILGHPLLVMPVATLLAARSHGADAATVRGLVVAVGALGGAVLVYALVQVRRGRWQHIDASRRGERLRLNGVLLIALGTAAAWAFQHAGPSPLAIALGAAAAIVAVALLLSRWLKLSLHVAFGVFAAFLPGASVAAPALFALAGAVAWSRLALQRHSPGDVVTGAVVGAAAGLLFAMA